MENVAQWEGKLKLVFCCRTKHETGVLVLEEQKRGNGLQLVYLFAWLDWPGCAQEVPVTFRG